MRVLCFSALVAMVSACGVETDDRPASWRYIHAAIIVPSCATAECHSAFAQAGGLSLEDRAATRDLFLETLDTPILRGTDNTRPRMPPDQPLPLADIELIQRWMDDGRPDN